MYTPYDYQQKGIEACVSILTSVRPRKELVVSPTGGGKSLYIAFAAKAIDFPLVVIQPSKELLEQNYKKYTELGGKAEIYSASMKTLEIGQVTFATIGSIKNQAAKLKKMGLKAMIIDEAHLGTQSDSQIRKFIKDVNIDNVLGLTATPVYLKGGLNGAELKMMNRVRGSMFKNIAHVTQIAELVEKGFWTKLIYKIESTKQDRLKLNSNGSDFTQDSQKEYYKENDLNSKIATEVESLIREGRKSILVFVPSIDEANYLETIIPNSAAVHSKMKPSERDDVVNKFKTLELRVAINVNILAVGFDHPRLDAIITGRSTNSIGIYYQQLGRGVRIHKDKKDCSITDFSGNFSRFGMVEELNFVDLPGYGWGMFTKDILLSNYPMEAKKRPTKGSLIKAAEDKRKTVFEVKTYQPDTSETMRFWFGKYKDKKLSEVFEKDKGYLVFLIEKFNFNTEKTKKLEKELKKILNLN